MRPASSLDCPASAHAHPRPASLAVPTRSLAGADSPQPRAWGPRILVPPPSWCPTCTPLPVQLCHVGATLPREGTPPLCRFLWGHSLTQASSAAWRQCLLSIKRAGGFAHKPWPKTSCHHSPGGTETVTSFGLSPCYGRRVILV